MIVCICRGVSDREIRQAIDDGAACLRELESKCIGDRCGMCVSELREMIEERTARSGAPACSQCCGMTSVKTA
jgi:bacterioferritin-associated ferredoxin